MHQLMATWLMLLPRAAAIWPIKSSSGARPGSTCLRGPGQAGRRQGRQAAVEVGGKAAWVTCPHHTARLLHPQHLPAGCR